MQVLAMWRVADYLVKTTRFSTALSLEPSLEAPLDEDYDYIYIDSGKLLHYASDGSSHTLRAFGGNINSSSFTGSTEAGKTILNFSLGKESGGREYSLSDTTELPNLTLKKEGIAPSGTVIKFSKLGEFAYQGPTNSSTSGSTTSTTTATTSSTAAPTGSDTTETTVLPTVQIRFDIMLSNSHEYKVKLTATSADNTYNQEVNATGSLAISAVFNDVPANSDYQYTVIRIQGNQVQRTGTINVVTNDVVILIKDND